MQLYEGDEGYEDIKNRWLNELRPQWIIVNGQAWVALRDNETLFFSYIPREDTLQPGTKGKWSNVYGYQPEE